MLDGKDSSHSDFARAGYRKSVYSTTVKSGFGISSHSPAAARIPPSRSRDALSRAASRTICDKDATAPPATDEQAQTAVRYGAITETRNWPDPATIQPNSTIAPSFPAAATRRSTKNNTTILCVSRHPQWRKLIYMTKFYHIFVIRTSRLMQ